MADTKRQSPWIIKGRVTMHPPRVYVYTGHRKREEIVFKEDDKDDGAPARVGIPKSDLDKMIERGVKAIKGGWGTDALAARGGDGEEVRWRRSKSARAEQNTSIGREKAPTARLKARAFLG